MILKNILMIWKLNYKMLTKKDIQNNVASNFKYARKQLEFTQEQMSDVFEIKRACYAAIEERRACTIQHVYKLSHLISVSMDTIFLTDLSKVK